MTCTWPGEVLGQLRDPSWMRLGLAISAARQMGLDKEADEIFFGQRRACYQLGKYPSQIRRLTWLKCFELDIQLSCWHGLLPTLTSPESLQTMASFNSTAAVSSEYATIIEIHRQTGMYLSALGDGLATTLSPSLVRLHHRALTNVKITHAQGWTINAEIALQAAQVYLFALCVVRLDREVNTSFDIPKSIRSDTSFLQEILAGTQSSAVQLICLLTSLSEQRNSIGVEQVKDSHPLSGTPKIVSCIAFFAAVVLLKYLESAHETLKQEDVEAARTAISSVHRMFTCCPTSAEHASAAGTLECAGRAIGNRSACIPSFITTRMGASILHNVIWMSGMLRGRDKDPEFSEVLTVEAVSDGPPHEHELRGVASTPIAAPEAFDGGAQAEFVSHFPFGVWDDALYDGWTESWNDDWMEYRGLGSDIDLNALLHSL
ncbi:hypothetical protein B0A48_09714 [Cryoendolithus antarcticus]|uniref:Xylanolytic transcriptional activator regulatory domain-containing protein n=1 Tax=Cryoendolithus antarcticus TaxID=1507870 RepID=A0A1V8T0D4_9PEZI|nr:hypothetical protein B0A48_09714 [Cryoendolithus antarcticus]